MNNAATMKKPYIVVYKVDETPLQEIKITIPLCCTKLNGGKKRRLQKKGGGTDPPEEEAPQCAILYDDITDENNYEDVLYADNATYYIKNLVNFMIASGKDKDCKIPLSQKQITPEHYFKVLQAYRFYDIRYIVNPTSSNPIDVNKADKLFFTLETKSPQCVAMAHQGQDSIKLYKGKDFIYVSDMSEPGEKTYMRLSRSNMFVAIYRVIDKKDGVAYKYVVSNLSETVRNGLTMANDGVAKRVRIPLKYIVTPCQMNFATP
jgi:hypothetical protein